MKGYLSGDGTKRNNNTKRKEIVNGRWEFGNLGKIGTQGLYYLMKSLG